MLTQLQTPIPLLTPKGGAWAVAIIDYGPHWDLLWVTFIRDTGECWTFSNQEIRQEKNQTFGLPAPSPIHTQESLKKNQGHHGAAHHGAGLNGMLNGSSGLNGKNPANL